jgi:hypothetical protein
VVNNFLAQKARGFLRKLLIIRQVSIGKRSVPLPGREGLRVGSKPGAIIEVI